jgi:hypothetical protein
MLAPPLRDHLKAPELRARYEQMTGYWTAPADSITLINLDEAPWTGKGEDDVAWVFVGIDSLACSGLEAVNVRIAREDGRYFIAQIEWGRP